MQRSLLQSFDPVISINSGQFFLWEKRNESWYGTYGSRIIKLKTIDGSPEFTSFPEFKTFEKKIFRLDDDIKAIFAELTRDPLVHTLIKKYPGLRLMRQEPEQCLFSFLCASNTNIPMIRRMLYNLTRRLGAPMSVDGMEFFTFPTAAEISKATTEQLRSCSLGYRAKAIKEVAQNIAEGTLNLESLRRIEYREAKSQLLQVRGIGNKIADCVLLFSLEKLDAFPIDVWISRALSQHYSWLLDRPLGDALTPRQYDSLSERMRLHFGRYAGYAQQYLYYDIRQRAGKKW